VAVNVACSAMLRRVPPPDRRAERPRLGAGAGRRVGRGRRLSARAAAEPARRRKRLLLSSLQVPRCSRRVPPPERCSERPRRAAGAGCATTADANAASVTRYRVPPAEHRAERLRLAAGTVCASVAFACRKGISHQERDA
jgi:hypothetical protein